MSTHEPARTAYTQVEVPSGFEGPAAECAFVPLSDGEVQARLRAVSRPENAVFDRAHGRRADSVTFQPCTQYSSQDRYVVQQLDVHGRKWTFTGVFDGHLGDATVEHTAYHLPIIVKQFLQKALTGPSSPIPGPEVIRDILSQAIISFDDAIAGDVLELFPGGIASLAQRSNEDIRRVINDYDGSGVNYKKAKLCMYGTTALVALVDPDYQNLWVANLGDCEAVLVSPTPNGRFKCEVLTDLHNGDNESEVQRVRGEHPGEQECVLNGRVLGAIAPFRCIGDAPFKQPAEFTRRILYNLYPGIPDSSPWDEFLRRNRTPPYISSHPDVLHRHLPSPLNSASANGQPAPPTQPHFLILATDGLTEQYEDFDREEMAEDWARCVGSAYYGQAKGPGRPTHDPDNLALHLLRHALGGDDAVKVSQLLTLDMDTPWMDDVTIVVQVL
ncbi:hypothetical protein EVG20_g8865 [Dentipellis fragilis]|uniref:PPM-type phosphatase domain-containing protein n=1 Tax=Dentipellis fragilis TaxID=205917 RepID=A0A4Y9Y4T4_9AGAM|nr:hypothetical protein EVG20_g8865 [Dentipellis fragilis]